MGLFTNIISALSGEIENLKMLIAELASLFTAMAGLGIYFRKRKKNGGLIHDKLNRIEDKVDKNHKEIYNKINKMDTRLSKVETQIEIYHSKKRGK